MKKLTDTQKIAKVINDNFEAIYNKLLSIEQQLKEKENENELKELWKNVCIAYINSSNSTEKKGGPNWADYVIEEYKKTFKIN